MIFPDIIFSFLVALLISVLLEMLVIKKKLRKEFFWIFIVIFFASWAGGIWGKPFGPKIWGIPWLPYIMAGLVAGYIIILAIPKPPVRINRDCQLNRKQTREMLDQLHQAKNIEKMTFFSLNIFMGIINVLLIVGIVVHYVK